MQTNNALLNETKQHLDRLAQLAVAIHNEGLASEAAALLSAETPADQANGVWLLGRTATDLINQQEYERLRLVNKPGYTPKLDAQVLINCDLHENLVYALELTR